MRGPLASHPVALRLTVVFAQLNADQTATPKALLAFDKKKAPNGEGSGVAILYRKDPTFETQHKDGVDDMVMMQELNDAELANNLKVRSTACGNRCMGVRFCVRVSDQIQEKPWLRALWAYLGCSQSDGKLYRYQQSVSL